MKLQDLRDERVALVKSAREILDTAETENRDLTAEEQQKYDRLMEKVDKNADKIKNEERVAALETALDEPINEAIKPESEERADGKPADPRATEEYRAAYSYWVATGDMAPEFRALQMDSDTAGGYTVLPQKTVMDLIKAVDNLVFIRQFATVHQVPKAESLGVPSLDNDPADANWTSELLTGSPDSTMSFGKREFYPHPLAKSIRVSNKLLRASALNVEALVRQRLEYKFGVTQEKAFLTGNGAMQPLGVFTASDDGISTSRDVSTGNTTTAITTDNLYECKYTLKAQYRPRSRWIFHRDAVKMIAKLKDGEGRYMWQPSISASVPDTILSMPVHESEYASNTFTASQYVGILGDFRLYWIADALDMTMQRLNELYAATNQTGFIARWETDGLPVLEEAFVRVKLSA
jgi:HK97 family phage major capsid protein